MTQHAFASAKSLVGLSPFNLNEPLNPMGSTSETFMQAAGLVAILLYLLSSLRVFPGRASRMLQIAAMVALGAAILLAAVETVRWFGGAK
ncbi:MAG: hypothetical protein QM651_05215 [Rhodoblastus sp.]